MHINYRDKILRDKLSKIHPTEEQLENALDMVITIKENEVVIYGAKTSEIKEHDCRVELLALYRLRDLLNNNEGGVT